MFTRHSMLHGGLVALALAVHSQCIAAGPVVDGIDWPTMLADHDLVWGSLPDSWDEAPFLGNGEQGTLMYKLDNQTLRWDVGCSAAHDHRPVDDDDLSEKHVEVLNRGRLFIGHLRVELPADMTGIQSRLSLWDAEARGTVTSSGGAVAWNTLVHATEPVMRFELTPSGDLAETTFSYVAEEARNPRAVRGGNERTPVNPSPVLSTLVDGVKTAVHNLWAGGQTAVACYEDEVGGTKRLWLSVQHTFPGAGAETQAVAAVRAAAAADQAAWVQTHRDWWHSYYPASFVSTGDAYWDAFYWIQQYKLACSTRDQGWIIDNQGPWLQPTAWNATWWNLNVQLSHSGVYKANRRAMGTALSHRLDINRDALERNVDTAYRSDSYAIGRTASGFDLYGHAGEPGHRAAISDANIGRECGNLLWGLHNVDLECRYWLDTGLRDDVLYPILTRAVNYYRHFLAEEGDGLYHLPSTHSPELANPSDCSYDIDLLHWGVGRLLELADEQGFTSAEEPLIPVWTDLQTKLVPAHTNSTGRMLGRNMPLNSGHRHWSHLLAIYPLRTLTPETTADRDLIQTSLDRWHSFGAGIAGYAFTGASCMSSLLGHGDDALSYLNTLKGYLRASTMYSEIGLPVIETPLHGATAIQEMLLQSWGGRLRIFPGVASSWTDVQFQQLRGEGGFLTTARREGGTTQWAVVEAEFGGTVDVEPQLVDADWTASSGVVVSNLGAGLYRVETAPGDWAMFWPDGTPQPTATVEPVAQRGADHRFGLPNGYVEEDTDPPSPDPMTFAIAPAAYDATTIAMEADLASDISGPVEYYFENTGNGDNSGWTTSTRWHNSGLTTGQDYSYRVRARDGAGNTGAWSAEASAAPADDAVAPHPDPMTWATPPTALSGRAISMTATTATDPTGVEYYFTCTAGGGNDSGWQKSPTYLDTGLEPETPYTYTVMAHDHSSNTNLTSASTAESATTLSEAGILFSDTFDRDNDTDLNASEAGKSGTLAPLNYTSRTFNSVTLDINNNTLRINGPASNGSYGGLVFINDHNFVGTGAGGFGISVDIAAYSTAGSGRWMTIGVGQSLAELNAQTGADPPNHASDLAVAYRGTTGALEIFKNGVQDTSESVSSGLPDAPTTMRIECVLSDYNAGSTVMYDVYFDDDETPFTSGAFTWSGPEENYISLASNLSNDSLFDNLEITGQEDPDPDEEAPTPDPMTWAVPPAGDSSSSITMTATTATDTNGVQYYFACTAGGGHDSGWQDDPTYTDTGLAPETTCTYTVKARDQSANQNETGASAAESATTPAASGGVGPIAGVDFENDADTAFDNTPDDLNPDDGISVSAGWTTSGTALGVVSDGGAQAAGSTSGSYVAKLNGGSTTTGLPSSAPTDHYFAWSITIPDTVVLNLTEMVFDWRQGTGTASQSRWGIFNTSLDGGPGGTVLWSLTDPVVRPNWENVTVDLSGAEYQNLSGTNVTFYWYTERTGSDIDTIVVSGAAGPYVAEVGDIRFERLPGSTELGLSWYGETGVSYGLEATDDLVAGTWEAITNVVGIGATISLTDEMDNPSEFYRASLSE